MSWSSRGFKRTLGVGIASFVIASALIAATLLGSLWTGATASAGGSWVTGALLLCAIGGVAAMMMGLMSELLRRERDVMAIVLPSSGLLVAVSALIELNARTYPVALYYTFSALVAAGLSGAMTYVALSGYLLTSTPRRVMACVGPALIGLVWMAGLFAGGWVSSARVASVFGLIREIVVAATPLMVILVTAGVRSYRLGQGGVWEACRLRFARAREDRVSFGASVVVFAGALVMALVMAGILSRPDSGDSVVSPGMFPWGGISLGWAGLVWLVAGQLYEFLRGEQQGVLTSSLANASAKRFLIRHVVDKPSWAASVGVRSAGYLVDHDPEGGLSEALPATFLQIRNEEIQRCVQDVLGPSALSQNAMANRIDGSIDAEVSCRPCLDALKMFCCLYLDAGPMVERRIKGLASLMPIVDPGMVRVLGVNDLSRALNRSQWFMFLEYDWIDQHVIHSSDKTRYGVRVGSLASHARHLIDSQQRRSAGGNVVWMGAGARSRLLQEAPMLASIVESSPITTADGRELLLFSARFEEIIPRLQKYYGLDDSRRSLADYEPSPQSARLLNLIGLQVNQATTVDELMSAAEGLSTVTWRGFKEKDGALQLVMAVFERIKTLHAGTDRAASDIETAREKLLRVVENIGYPSQILHHAQIDKLALRKPDALIRVAGSPRHARFHEAWMLLASGDPKRYDQRERDSILAFLESVPRQPGVSGDPFVQGKAIEAFATIARDVSIERVGGIGRVAGAYLTWAVRDRFDGELAIHLLDVLSFLEAQYRVRLEIPSSDVELFDRLAFPGRCRERWEAFKAGLLTGQIRL